MTPEQRQEWEDDEDALRRETAEAHAPATESTESDAQPKDAPGTIDPFYARRTSYRELILRHWRLKSDGYLWSIEDVLDAVTALADEEHAEAKREIARLRDGASNYGDGWKLVKSLRAERDAAKREIARLHRDALAEAQAYRAMFARAQEAEAKVEAAGTRLGEVSQWLIDRAAQSHDVMVKSALVAASRYVDENIRGPLLAGQHTSGRHSWDDPEPVAEWCDNPDPKGGRACHLRRGHAGQHTGGRHSWDAQRGGE